MYNISLIYNVEHLISWQKVAVIYMQSDPGDLIRIVS